jgi:carbon starvation protein
MPSVLLSSALVVGSWGYFLYIGVIDPNGGVNLLWPMFGIANQMLAAIALCVSTGILIKSGKLNRAWITGIPLTWLVFVTSTAAYEKIFSTDIRVGFFAAANDMSAKLVNGSLPPDRAKVAPQLIFNLHLDAWLTMFFVTVLWVIVLDMLRMSSRHLAGKPIPPTSESPHMPSRMVEDFARD